MPAVTCRVSPNARRSEFAGWTMDEKGRPVLLIKLHAVPVEGQANDELLRFFMEALACSKGEVVMIRGQTSSLKVVELSDEAVAKLPAR